MDNRDEELGSAAQLRRMAEAQAEAERGLTPEELQALTLEGTSQMFHTLRVHQIELEMQNEELRRAQAELEAARSRYFDLYDLAPVGYCTLSDQGILLEANLTATNLLGTQRGVMVGQNITRFILAEDQDIYYLHRKRLSATGVPQACELRMLRQDQTSFWAHLDSSAVQDEEHRAVLRVALSDISERKRSEEERLHLQLHLNQAQKLESLGRLAGGVAHDMNNVLAAILGLASVNLETQPKDSGAYRAFDTIAKAAVRGGNTVKSLLAFAHQQPAEEQEIDLNSILREEVRLLERTTLARVRLEMDLDPGLRPIRGEASALTHALMNLCVNAVDAMPENGILRLITRNLGDSWVEVVVEDTGCGMSKENLEKALDPFFTTKEVGKGTGLGLSMVYSTVEAHQGHLAIHSEPGRGTRIEMQFPACEAQAKSMDVVPEPLREPLRAPLEVLVVDDDELVHTAMRTLLETLGHRTTVAASGEAALKRLEAGYEPDVVILDMNMPGLGGGGTLPRLHALRPGLPVLIATGRVDQAVHDLLKSDSDTTLMPKPFSLDQLRSHLDQVQPKRKAGRILRRIRRAGGGRRQADAAFREGDPGYPGAPGFPGAERRRVFPADRRRV